MAADARAVAALEADLFGTEAWSVDQVRDELTGETRHALVDERDGELAGYAVVMVLGDVADLQRIGVRPDLQRGGVAASLLDAGLEAARSRGADRMLLEVSEANAGARAFYADRGFSELDRRRRYYRDGSDALVLARPLG
ncbi:hypothetical protein GCM10027026_43030 [Myroides odoratimimus subsp. xuanwuensis]